MTININELFFDKYGFLFNPTLSVNKYLYVSNKNKNKNMKGNENIGDNNNSIASDEFVLFIDAQTSYSIFSPVTIIYVAATKEKNIGRARYLNLIRKRYINPIDNIYQQKYITSMLNHIPNFEYIS